MRMRDEEEHSKARVSDFKVVFSPLNVSVSVLPGGSLMDLSRKAGIDLVSLCGGSGKCGRCKVLVAEGKTGPVACREQAVLTEMELDKGFRLACQVFPEGDLVVAIPPGSLSAPQRVQTEGLDVVPAEADPAVRGYDVVLNPPSLFDASGDDERLLSALEAQYGVTCERIDTEVQKQLPETLRSMGWEVSASVRGSEVLRVGRRSTPCLGLAIDLGTTKLAAYLVDLTSGKVQGKKGTINPQIAYGEDVVTRINWARKSPTEAARMQALAVEGIMSLAGDLGNRFGAGLEKMVDVVIVGNTAMHHLVLGLPLDQLARAPHVPAVSRAVDVKARDIGLTLASGAYGYFPANVAGFIGSDHVAMIQSTGMHRAEDVILALDIGTNTEICLRAKGELTSVSCASGPAFEGGNITCGMRATEGAIERVEIIGEEVACHTIGHVRPVGVCGSGILDAVSQFHLSGIIDRAGRMIEAHPHICRLEDQKAFLLFSGEDGGPEIVVTQKDIRAVQLAKAAIRAGIQVLLDERGLSERDIERVLVAGAFGSYLDIGSAVTVGMLPPIPMDRFYQVGNAAGLGARLALISKAVRVECQEIARKVRYLELASVPRFKEIFLEATFLGNRQVGDCSHG